MSVRLSSELIRITKWLENSSFHKNIKKFFVPLLDSLKCDMSSPKYVVEWLQTPLPTNLPYAIPMSFPNFPMFPFLASQTSIPIFNPPRAGTAQGPFPRVLPSLSRLHEPCCFRPIKLEILISVRGEAVPRLCGFHESLRRKAGFRAIPW